MHIQSETDIHRGPADAVVCAGHDGTDTRTDRIIFGRRVLIGPVLRVRGPQLVGRRHAGGLYHGKNLSGVHRTIRTGNANPTLTSRCRNSFDFCPPGRLRSVPFASWPSAFSIKRFANDRLNALLIRSCAKNYAKFVRSSAPRGMMYVRESYITSAIS